MQKEFLSFECNKECPYSLTCCRVPTEVIRHGDIRNIKPGIDILIFGMGAGKDEEKQKRCFVGRAGKYMRNIIKYMWDTIGEFNVALSNNVRFRPEDENGKDREPTPTEISRCIGYLYKDILTLRPRAIVPVGRNATSSFSPIGDTPMGKLRGVANTYCPVSDGTVYEFKYIPTWHPSYLARSYGSFDPNKHNLYDKQFISDILLALE